MTNAKSKMKTVSCNMITYLGGAEVDGDVIDIVALISLIIGALLDLLRLACSGQSTFMAVSPVSCCKSFINILPLRGSVARYTEYKLTTHLQSSE